ncbi:hypothetical protein [Burkholderia ambifaria]|uniref:hypothetical protein n=1 Tax=Burkholderia ambifaria TaxID=152480 RepID=UPI000F811124|nr:hypothetical protein [Burkholderia ambifaria]
MDKAEVQQIFQAALVKREEADAARAALADVMLRTMRALLPAGTLLELNRRPVPEYLVRVRTMSGNDRGTRTFRVVQVVSVDVDPLRPELSKWICDAVPVSEKTGKDMSAATHGASSRSTVRLHGDIGFLGHDEHLSESRDRLVALVATNG